MKPSCILPLLGLWPLLPIQTQAPSAPVHVASVVEQKVASTVELVGTVMPLRRSIVASGADGLVEECFVREGDKVEPWQELARLRVRTLQIQQSAAKAALEESEHELQELKARSEPEEERARAALAAGVAKEKMAQGKYQRLERLLARNAASGENLDEALGQAVMAKEDLARLKAEHEMAKAPVRDQKIKQSEARVETARAELARVRDEIDKRTVRVPRFKPPFLGYVVAIHTEVGQWLSTSSPVVELVDLSMVEVEVMVPERHLQEMRLGRDALVRMEALDDRMFKGTLSRVVRQADTKSRLFPVKILIKNPSDESGQPLIQAGMFAVARLPLGVRHQARLVPKDALVLQAGRSVVYVVEPNGNEHKVAAVAVKPGAAHDGLVEVDGNLKPGQLVVVRGNERLAPGQTVQIESRSEEGSGFRVH